MIPIGINNVFIQLEFYYMVDWSGYAFSPTTKMGEFFVFLETIQRDNQVCFVMVHHVNIKLLYTENMV